EPSPHGRQVYLADSRSNCSSRDRQAPPGWSRREACDRAPQQKEDRGHAMRAMPAPARTGDAAVGHATGQPFDRVHLPVEPEMDPA
ncbi:MAG TPA: hypothetical protein VGD94_02840, partial [Vicinamibacterales bacterium]